jgi:hypothetical protein
MGNATKTETTKDWRPAWRAFAKQARPKLEDSNDDVAQASLEDVQDGPFQGFGSPPGRF